MIAVIPLTPVASLAASEIATNQRNLAATPPTSPTGGEP